MSHPLKHKFTPRRARRRRPILSLVLLTVLIVGCLCCGLFLPKDPTYLDLAHPSAPPGGGFLLGTDTLGRDIFSMLWYGGRASLFIGFASTLLSTCTAVLLGTASALSPVWLDRLLMRGTEIFLSIPSLLLTVSLQAAMGKPNAVSIALAIGLTGWPSMAKVVRAEVGKLHSAGYIEAARSMGAGFLYTLYRHLLPNLFPSIMFMVVMQVRSAIAAESTLSFMGLGLPVESVSWGSMLSLAESSLLSGAWWIILIPGLCLTITLLSLTEIGNYLRRPAGPTQRTL